MGNSPKMSVGLSMVERIHVRIVRNIFLVILMVVFMYFLEDGNIVKMPVENTTLVGFILN